MVCHGEPAPLWRRDTQAGGGGKAGRVRLVFNVAGGPAIINALLMDMGNRFRLLVSEVEAVAPQHDLPKLPAARVLWKPLPDMKTGCAAWILAGGAHHTCQDPGDRRHPPGRLCRHGRHRTCEDRPRHGPLPLQTGTPLERPVLPTQNLLNPTTMAKEGLA